VIFLKPAILCATKRSAIGLVIVAIVMVTMASCSLQGEGNEIPEGIFVDNTEFDDSFGDVLPGAKDLKDKTWLVIGDSISTRGIIGTNYEQYISTSP
jgi:hypothetical protein